MDAIVLILMVGVTFVVGSVFAFYHHGPEIRAFVLEFETPVHKWEFISDLVLGYFAGAVTSIILTALTLQFLT